MANIALGKDWPDKTSWHFRGLVIATLLAVFGLVTLGGVVRVTDSGLACPDWPLCHGKIVPPLEYHVLLEYAHRLLAALVGLLVVISVVVAWRQYRNHRWLVIPLTASLALVIGEGVLGGWTVLDENSPVSVTAHLALSQAIFAMLLLVLLWSWRPPLGKLGSPPIAKGQAAPPLFWWAAASAVATFVVLLSGSYTVGRGAGAACPSWPWCDGSLIPSSALTWTHMAHRLLAGLTGLLVLWVGILAWRRRKDDLALGWAGGIVILAVIVQVLVGAANPWSGFAAAAQAAHLSMATATWGSLVLLAGLAWRHTGTELAPQPSPDSPAGRRRLRDVLADYIALTKPAIVLLLLVTALGGMVLAEEGMPPLRLIAAVMVGGALASGGAGAINNWMDRDLDRLMRRTSRRPVASQRVFAWDALALGLILNVLAFTILALWANVLSASLALAGTLFYLLVYTKWLKRSTTQNIVIGGAAGALPPLVGWAAVTGSLALPAFYLFAIVFFWTPPHFWALSLLLKDDYATARVPMLPVVQGEARTCWSIFLYTVLLVALTLLLLLVAKALGVLYLVGSLLLGLVFVAYALRLFLRPDRRVALRLYLYSLLYLALLFGVIMVDGAL